MLWKFETCFKILYDMAGKAGLSNSAYESMLHNPVMPAHCVSKVSFAREVFPHYSIVMLLEVHYQVIIHLGS